MDTSIFLAKIIGLYFLIVGFWVLVRGKALQEVLEEFIQSRAIIFIIAVITLILGLLLVISHNIWVSDWRVVVTLLCWLTLVSGLVRLFFPQVVVAMAGKFRSSGFRIASLFMMILGGYLTYKGFF